MAGEWIVNDKENWEDADGINAKELGKRLASDLTKFGSGVKDSFSETFRKEDDNIVVLDGTKTLLGDDFTTLYESSGIEEYDTNDGSVVKAVKSTCSYDTEMHSGMCSVANFMSYDLLSNKEKAMYEVTLLSKYYANQYSDDSEKNKVIAKEYTDKMVMYRNYCEQNNISWVDVCVGVDIELQTECANYLDANEHVFNNRSVANADDNRIITNRAHGLLYQCVPDDYMKVVCPSATNIYPNLTVEDTLDTSTRYTNFLVRIKEYFVEKWNIIRENFPRPIKSLKQGFFVATDELGEMMDESLIKADKYQQEVSEGLSDMKEQSEELINDVKDKTQEQLDKFNAANLPDGSSSNEEQYGEYDNM